ncbi:hypothetical protein GA0070216_107178 [Micromonospora matsumotoense]|uniref:Glutathionylspermidine synthase pre-ATP-grasp-like domain-containing protein n=1 Tax=Micromonospora matsumotoense TaxID=121616 RepID=A0A1C4YUT7_9ACTN|nr:circularly permuted type 2 ATP-grasp protein [Micromonospora matsumotoense]SCF24458.1 hypothetical protein GA0070216_107178 [Micromonospora matsumotoense]
MNLVTDHYLRESSAEGSGLISALRDAPLPASYRTCWGSRMLPRPLFVAQQEIDSVAADICTVFDLLTSLPDRLYDGDVIRYCAALGIDQRRSTLLRSFSRQPITRYGRVDLYHDGGSFRILEMNVASDLGGIDRSVLNSALLALPDFSRFAETHRLSFVHTGEHVNRALQNAAPCSDPAVAMICANGELARYRHLLDSSADMLRSLGTPVFLGELGDVRVRGGRLYLHGSRVDVVLRYFTIDHAVDDEDVIASILDAHDSGNVTLWTTMDSSLYSNKGALSILSDPGLGICTAAERRMLDRILPWTRLLTPELVGRCLTEREHMILKPRRDFGGAGIHAGWEHSDQRWRSLVQSCVGQGYIAQRRVVPVAERISDPDTGTTQEWIATWGVFVTPLGYAGTDIRAAPASAGAVVNYGGNPATRVTGVFTYPADLAAPDP